MSNIITLTISDLQTVLQNQPNFKGTLLEDHNFNEDDHIEQYFGETRNWSIISSDTFSFDGDQTITIDTDSPNPFHQAEAFSDYVSRSYDDQEYPWETNAWESDLVRISGDDDVDYNSSYIDIIIEALNIYLNGLGLTQTT